MTHGIPGVGRTHFLVYSDATEPFASNAASFCEAAIAAGFDTATHYTRERLEKTDFWSKQRHILEGGARAGHGAWKPHILLEALRTVGPDDVVVLHDAGSHPPGALPQMPRFPRDAIALAARSRMRFIHGSAAPFRAQEQFTRRDCLVGLDADGPEMRRAPLISASPLIYLPSDAAFAFIGEWLQHCLDPDLVTDAPDRKGETSPLMRRHLQEEAIGSILAHRHGAAHFDPATAAPALFQTVRRRKRALPTPEAHLSVLAWMLEKAENPAMLVRNLDQPAPVARVTDRAPLDVLRDELKWIGRRGQGRVCIDHLQGLLSGNRIVNARLHGLKDRPLLADDFWRQTLDRVNRRLADASVGGATSSVEDIEDMMRASVRDALSDMPVLDDELLAECVWARLGQQGRDAFKTAHGNSQTEAGAGALAQFLDFLRVRNFPAPDLEATGDLKEFDARLLHHLSDWLLLDHL